MEFFEKLRDYFDEMVVYKDLQKTNFFSALSLPAFMRDWLLKKFEDETGEFDKDDLLRFVKKFIPRKDDWNSIKNRIIVEGEKVKFLAKISVNIDIKTGEISFALPDFGLGFKDTIIESSVWEDCKEELVKGRDIWGMIELFYELSKKQTIINTKTQEQMYVKLIQMSNQRNKRRCRLCKNAIPILDWIGTREYYEEMFPNNKLGGGSQKHFRNDMVAEAVMMMLESDIEVLPTKLPELRLSNRYNSFNGRSCFYSTRHLKRTLNKGINKIVSSRIVGAMFAGNNVYAVYNTRSSAIKWKGMNEMKTRYILTDLARVNGDLSECNNAIIFGKDDKTILSSFFNQAESKNKDFRFDKIYQNVYAIPQNPNGIELLQLFKTPNFQEKILTYMFEEKDICRNSGYGWNAVIDGVYVFSYLDANIAALSRFYETAKRRNGKNKFMVICYDFQEKFIRGYFEGLASIATMSFQEILLKIGGNKYEAKV